MLILDFILLLLSHLNPLAWLGALRRLSYRGGLLSQVQPSIPVVSIGNLSFGGTGKSPHIKWLAERSLQAGKKVIIVNRNYRASSAQPGFVNPTDAQVKVWGDEACMLAEMLPEAQVYSGPHKTQTVSYAITQSPSAQVVILDDGFQHLKLAAKFNIILIDCSDPWGFGVFPFGRGREWIWALKDADLIILTKSNTVTGSRLRGLKKLVAFFGRNQVPVVTSENYELGPSVGPETPLVAVAGLARNTSFFARTYIQYGSQIKESLGFSDHQNYDAEALKSIRAALRRYSGSKIVTTQKDWIKLRHTDLAPLCLVVNLKVEVNLNESSVQVLNAIYS